VVIEVWIYLGSEWHAKPLAALRHPADQLVYALCALGGAFPLPDAASRCAWAIGAATISLALFAVLLQPFARRTAGRAESARAAMIASALFTLGSLSIIAVGRVHLGVESALAGRYTTAGLLFTALLLLLGWTDSRPRVRTTAALVAAVMSTAAVLQQPTRLRAAADALHLRGPAALACLCSVRDARAIDAALGSVDELPLDLTIPFLRARGWSAFASGRHLALGRPLADVLGGGSIAACDGGIDAIEPIPDTGWGVRVRGFAKLPDGASMPRWGFLVDGDERVVGLCDVSPTTDVASMATFAGIATAAGNDADLGAVLGDGGTCWRVAGLARAARLEVAVAAGPPLADVTASGLEAFARPDRDALARPEANEFDDALASTAQSIGVVTIGPFPAIREFLLPIATGPMTFGTGAAVLDHTGRVVRVLRPAPTFGQWRRWRIEVPQALVGQLVTIKVADTGNRDGQWIAFARPREVAR